MRIPEEYWPGFGVVTDESTAIDYDGVRWRDIFRRAHRGWRCYKITSYQGWLDIVSIVEYLGLPAVEMVSGGSPAGHPAGASYAYGFLDGGVVYYHFPPRLVIRAEGYNVMRLLCYELDIPQPRKWRDEDAVPSHDELLDMLEKQRQDEKERYHLQLSASNLMDDCYMWG